MLLILALTGCASTTPVVQPGAGTSELPAVEDVVSVVKRALHDAQRKINDQKALPPLEAVTLTLQTSVTKTLDGTFKIVVVTFGETVEAANTQQVTIKLIPPPPTAPQPIAADNSTYKALVDAIVGAADAARRTTNAAHGEPTPLVLNSIATEIAVSIKRTTTGGLGIDITPITISGKGSVATLNANKINISFKTP